MRQAELSYSAEQAAPQTAPREQLSIIRRLSIQEIIRTCQLELHTAAGNTGRQPAAGRAGRGQARREAGINHGY